jgi:hypothetical protein
MTNKYKSTNAGLPIRFTEQLASLFISKRALYLLLIPYLVGGQLKAAQDFEIWFMYKDVEEGPTLYGSIIFANAHYRGDAEDYCADDHRTPDGGRYTHGHVVDDPFAEPFYYPLTDHTVTAQKSDWAWDAALPNHTRVSGSTFRHNCYSHAAEAPTPMIKESWELFTELIGPCDEVENRRSFFQVPDHAIAITVMASFSYGCTITATSEKFASGGVYTAQYSLPGGLGANPIRKRK